MGMIPSVETSPGVGSKVYQFDSVPSDAVAKPADTITADLMELKVLLARGFVRLLNSHIMFTQLDFNDFLDKVLANNEAEIHVHDMSKGLEEEAMVRMTISEFKWEFKDPGGALLSALNL